MSKPSSTHPLPAAPRYHDLPKARNRPARGAPELTKIQVNLEVVTPILGGSCQTRTIDDVDVIRVPSVRGHLRFWWRALYACRYASSEDLYRRESELRGRAAANDGGRSAVEVRIRVMCAGSPDSSEIRLYPSQGQKATPGAYALWPARGDRKDTPPAPRRHPGTQFVLTLQVAGTESDVTEVKNALRAWILFGGYGSRTRRGLGSLTVIGDGSGWLPAAATREAFTQLFGHDIFAYIPNPLGDVPNLGDVPKLCGAGFHIGQEEPGAEIVWETALDWLKEFRQGTQGPPGDRAREPGAGKAQPNRPSISNWPEADKIRHIKGKTSAHRPRHNATPAWPRAGFGLPIIGQFQTQDRTGQRFDPRNPRKGGYDELGPFELRWRAGTKEHDRLASPLIVKALPLADGSFVPCALWLNRGYPKDAQVGLVRERKGQKEIDPSSVAPFDRLVATGDTPCFSALAGKTSLRQAFFNWLRTQYQTTVVAP